MKLDEVETSVFYSCRKAETVRGDSDQSWTSVSKHTTEQQTLAVSNLKMENAKIEAVLEEKRHQIRMVR